MLQLGICQNTEFGKNQNCLKLPEMAKNLSKMFSEIFDLFSCDNSSRSALVTSYVRSYIRSFVTYFDFLPQRWLIGCSRRLRRFKKIQKVLRRFKKVKYG